MQLDLTDSLLRLSATIPWQEFEDECATHYKKHTGAPSKPIRLMVGLLRPKQREKKRKLCQGRAAIEPIIWPLEIGFQTVAQLSQGAIEDHINLLMAARLEFETMAAF